MVDIEKYTGKILLENLALIELHLAEYTDSPDFCRECLFKHALILSGGAKECIGVCNIGGDIWHKIASWGEKLSQTLPTMTQKEATQLKTEARNLRKELEAYFITCTSEACELPSPEQLRKRRERGHLQR